MLPVAIKARTHNLEVISKDCWKILLAMGVSEEHIELSCARMDNVRYFHIVWDRLKLIPDILLLIKHVDISVLLGFNLMVL